MNKRLRKFCTAALTGVLLAGALPLGAFADEPYDVYNYDRWGEAIPSQAGYIAERSVSGEDLGISHFANPSDIFRDYQNQFYVCDKGNNRIVVVDTEWTRVLNVLEKFTLPDGSVTTLKNPTGVFVSPENKLVYIADTENSRVLISDTEGNVKMEITKPESEVYDQDLTFLPQKVLLDKACNVYVVLNNTTSGACVFDPKGNFTGFYGANRVEQSAEVAARYFWSAIATDEMRDKMKASVPSGFSNFDLDAEGFIFTSTESYTQQTDRVKKVNPAGYNLFADYEVYWGDSNSLWYSGTTYATRIVDIDISDDGMINCLDLTTGRVFQYDEECNLLFILGTTGDQVGGFKQVSALETLDTNIYVLDAGKNTVTIFGETSFGSIVHEATNLYNAGYYEEALEPWQEVLKRDGNYRRAYIGIASAMLKKGDYAESMKYAKLADSPYRYNEAFEGYRSEFLKKYFNIIIIGALVLIVGGYGFYRWRKKKRTQEAAGKEGDAQ